MEGLDETALVEKIVQLEDALRSANQRESEREAAREKERETEEEQRRRFEEQRKQWEAAKAGEGCHTCLLCATSLSCLILRKGSLVCLSQGPAGVVVGPCGVPLSICPTSGRVVWASSRPNSWNKSLASNGRRTQVACLVALECEHVSHG